MSRGITTLANFPNPVVTPYTTTKEKNNNQKRNKQKQKLTTKKKVRFWHVLNGRLLSLRLAHMARAQALTTRMFPKVERRGRASVQGEVSDLRSPAISFFFFFFCFLSFFFLIWSPEQPRDFLCLALGDKLSIILSESPRAMQLTDPSYCTCLVAL